MVKVEKTDVFFVAGDTFHANLVRHINLFCQNALRSMKMQSKFIILVIFVHFGGWRYFNTTNKDK